MARAQHLAGSEWRPIEIGGRPLAAGTALFIRFGGDGNVAGNGGCNRIFGAYRIDRANLRIGPLATTRKACAADVMALETAFVHALDATRLYLRDQTRLTLKSGQGATTLRLVQTDWD